MPPTDALTVPDGESRPAPTDRKAVRLVRIVLLLVLAATLYWQAQRTGLAEHLSIESVRRFAQEGGTTGVAVYFAAFALRDLTQIPAALLIATGVLAYGHVFGGLLGYFGALVSANLCFVLTRGIGGSLTTRTGPERIRRLLRRVHDRPILTVVLLRSVLMVATFLNCALALTPIRFRDYLIGSLIGLVPPVLVNVLFWSWLMNAG